MIYKDGDSIHFRPEFQGDSIHFRLEFQGDSIHFRPETNMIYKDWIVSK